MTTLLRTVNEILHRLFAIINFSVAFFPLLLYNFCIFNPLGQSQTNYTTMIGITRQTNYMQSTHKMHFTAYYNSQNK